MANNHDLLVQSSPPVAVVSFNRPDKLNALNISMVGNLLETLRRLEHDERIHLVVLRGEGRAFCAGGDIDVMRGSIEHDSLADVERVTRTFQETIKHIRQSKHIYVSFVQGSAMGGGAGLALSADLVYAREDTSFGWPYASLGLGPDGGASYELTHALGRYKALESMLFSRRLTAAEMEKRGMVNEVIGKDDWEERIAQLLSELSNYPATLLSGLKNLIQGAEDFAPAKQLSLEYQTMITSAELPFHRGKVAEFFNRKRPAAGEEGQ